MRYNVQNGINSEVTILLHKKEDTTKLENVLVLLVFNHLYKLYFLKLDKVPERLSNEKTSCDL